MARERDYAAEYAQRIANGLERGLSRSQAAGHPRISEPSITEIRAEYGSLENARQEQQDRIDDMGFEIDDLTDRMERDLTIGELEALADLAEQWDALEGWERYEMMEALAEQMDTEIYDIVKAFYP